jgi:hypothetical protein
MMTASVPIPAEGELRLGAPTWYFW